MSFEHHLVRLFEKPELKTKQDGTPYFTALVTLKASNKIIEIACIGDKTESYYYDLLSLKDDFEIFGNNKAGTLWLRGIKSKNNKAIADIPKREVLVFHPDRVEVVYGQATWTEPLENFTDDKQRRTDLFANIFRENSHKEAILCQQRAKKNKTTYQVELQKRIEEEKTKDRVSSPVW